MTTDSLWCGRRLRLEPLRDRHIRELHAIATAGDAVERWPYAGGVDAREFKRHIWRISALTLAVVRQDKDEVIGAIQGIDPRYSDGVVDIAFFVRDDLWLAGWPFEALVVMFEYLFQEWSFRKIYFRMRESDLAVIGAARRWLIEEARYRDHYAHASSDRYEDVVFLSLHRDAWDSRLAGRILGRAPLECTVSCRTP